jgi:recombinational DNA repair protein RecT
MENLLAGRVDPKAFAALCLNAARGNQKLLESFEASPGSLLAAMQTCAQLALEPNGPKKEAYLIPRWNKNLNNNRGGQEATLQIGYHGLIKMATRSKNFGRITTGCLTTEEMEAGVFDFAFEPPELRHGFKPGVKKMVDMEINGDFTYYDRWKKTKVPMSMPVNFAGAYARVETKDGQIAQVFLTPEEVHARRMRSSAPNGNFWVNDFSAMARKSAVRALFASGEVALSEDLAIAVSLDQKVDEGGESMESFSNDIKMRADIPKALPKGPQVTGAQEFGSEPDMLDMPEDPPEPNPEPIGNGDEQAGFGQGSLPLDPPSTADGPEWPGDPDDYK